MPSKIQIDKQLSIDSSNEREMREFLVFECETCLGKGKLQNAEWKSWWKHHTTDWQQALADKNIPPVPEWTVCSECGGTGGNPTPAGLALLDFLGQYRGPIA